jgi:hypothetical protein
MAQTTIQILRCLTLGRYTARVVDGKLEIEGPQPLTGPLPDSIKARRDELVAFLTDHFGGVWPPKDRAGVELLEEQVAAVLNNPTPLGTRVLMRTLKNPSDEQRHLLCHSVVLDLKWRGFYTKLDTMQTPEAVREVQPAVSAWLEKALSGIKPQEEGAA